MSTENVTAREAIAVLVERSARAGLGEEIVEALNTGKVVKEELSRRRRTKRIEKPSRRVALSDVEALREAVRVYRAAFLELPAVFNAINSEIRRHKAVDREGKSAEPATGAEIELRGEERVTDEGPETVAVKPTSEMSLDEMQRLIAHLGVLLTEVRE